MRLRNPVSGKNGSLPKSTLCKIEAETWHHIIVTYKAGELICYKNGEQVYKYTGSLGDFSNWSDHQLIFGDEYKDLRDWAGSLMGIAIYSRFIDEKEAKRHFRAFEPNLRRLR